MKWLRVLVLLLACEQSAFAQRLSGVIRDSVSRAPLSGVVVTLLDSSRAPLSHAFSDEDGRYFMALAPRGVQLRIVHIGYQPLTLPLPRATTLDVGMTKVPTLLGGLYLNNERICSNDKDRRPALSLWEQAHAALLASVVAREAQPATAMLMRYARSTDTTLRIIQQTAELATVSTTRPFVAGATPSVLADRGYMQTTSEGRIFSAPDADVLLTESFAETHCFSVQAADSVHQGMIGLAFEPAPGRQRVVDVRGALWMSAKTPTLNSIEYRYTGGESIWERGGSMGMIHFRTESNGVVFVDQWFVRLPLFTGPVSPSRQLRIGGRVVNVPAGSNQAVTLFHQTGGFALSATWPNDLHYDAGLEPLRGVIMSSDGVTPLPGALVIIRSTNDTITADEKGRFEFSPILPGRYVIAVVDTSYASYVSPRVIARDLDVAVGHPNENSFTLPSRLDALQSLCGGAIPPGTSVLVGRLADSASRERLPGETRLEAAWLRANGAERETQTVSLDDAGRFTVCGVPRDKAVRLSVQRRSSEFADTSVVVAPGSVLMSLDWKIDVTTLASAVAPKQAGVQGRVLRVGTSAPIANAEVWLATQNRRTTTDSAGTYRFADVAPGPTLLQVRSVGYTARRDTITLIAGQMRSIDLALQSQSALLDTVRTVAASSGKYMSPALREFEERRLRQVSGYFIADSVLRVNDDRRLASILLTHVSGMTLVPGRMGAMYMVSSRKICQGRVLSGCVVPNRYVTVYMDGILLYSSTTGGPPVDANQLMVSELGGVEFYAGSGVGPPQFNATGGGCGILVLWTRER